jgi:hypothetical protein
MKTMRFIIILPLLLMLAGPIFAQNDILYLNDGSVIRGTIMEHLVGKHSRIRTLDGKTMEFPAYQVDRLRTRRGKQGKLERQAVSVKENGYYNNTTLGFLLGFDHYGRLSAGPSLQMVQGYQFKGRMNVGLGTGLELIRNNAMIPAFAEFRYHLRKSGFSPFVSARAGYNFQLTRNYNWRWEEAKSQGGIMTGAEVGVRNYGKQRLGWTASLGYRFQQMSSSYDWEFWNEGDVAFVPVVERTRMHRVEMRFGILFH